MGRKRVGTWVVLSTSMPMSRLCLEGTPEAFKLWVLGLCLARQQQTAGDVGPNAAVRLAGVNSAAADELLELGYWHRPEHGCEACLQPPRNRIQIHRYSDWQDLPEEIAARSESGRHAARMRHASGSQSDPHTEVEVEVEVEEKQEPRERGSGYKKSKPLTPAPSSLPLTDEMVNWAEKTFGVTNRDWLERQTQDFIDWAQASGQQYREWGVAWKRSIRRALEHAGRARVGNSNGQPSEEEVQRAMREWKWSHPLRPPAEFEELMSTDLEEYKRRMKPLRDEHEVAARAAALKALNHG